MREMENDEVRTGFAMAVARMWKDPEYKQQFISDPKSALSREGVSLGEHTLVKVVEETPAVKYVDLGSENQSALEIAARLLPLADGQEVRLVQSTDSLRYLVLPAAPGWISSRISKGNDLKFSSEKTPSTIISETAVVGAQALTVDTVQIETQQSVSAEELIVESVVVVETVNQSAQEVQLIEVSAEFEVSISEGMVVDTNEVTVAEMNVANVATVAETVTIA